MIDEEWLVRQLAAIRGDIAELRARPRYDTEPYRFVLLAKKTGSGDKTWVEQTVAGGAIKNMLDGRRCTSDAHASAFIDPDEDMFFLVMYFDPDGNARYVRIQAGGGGAELPIGTLQGQVYQMVSDLSAGWEFPLSHE